MAARKTTKATVKGKKTSKTKAQFKKTTASRKQNSVKANFFANLLFGESYTSLALGIIAVVIATVLILSFFSSRQASKPNGEVIPTVADVKTFDITITPTPTPSKPSIVNRIYTVVTGDSLWQIAEKVYGSGYNWVDIAKTNNLKNPNQIFAGNRLILPSLPSVRLKDATVMTGENEAQVSRTVRIVNETYTVVEGDDLWDIAVRSYGDGYQWTKIARANNLVNPDIIHVGNVLKIPRD